MCLPTDVGDRVSLGAVSELLSRIQMPPGVGNLARSLRLRTPGLIAVAAGIHGIVYSSVRNSDRHCLAVFPQNWRSSTSMVEIAGRRPLELAVARLDGTSDLSFL